MMAWCLIKKNNVLGVKINLLPYLNRILAPLSKSTEAREIQNAKGTEFICIPNM